MGVEHARRRPRRFVPEARPTTAPAPSPPLGAASCGSRGPARRHPGHQGGLRAGLRTARWPASGPCWPWLPGRRDVGRRSTACARRCVPGLIPSKVAWAAKATGPTSTPCCPKKPPSARISSTRITAALSRQAPPAASIAQSSVGDSERRNLAAKAPSPTTLRARRSRNRHRTHSPKPPRRPLRCWSG